MTYRSFTLAILMLIGFVAIGFASSTTPQKCADYYKGTITFKNGKSKEAYIFIDNCNPHLFQSGLRIIDEKSFKKYKKGKKIKKKVIEKFKVKQIQSFVLENGREFRQVKYLDLSATTKIGMLPKRFFLEVIADGEITVFRKFYRTKNGFIHRPVMDSWLEGGQQHLDFITNNFELLVQKDKAKNPRNIKNVNLKNYIGDKEAIDEKYLNGDYEFSSQLQRTSSFATNCDTPFMEALLKLVNDYNNSQNGYANTEFSN
ncbi:hypothetical protein [Croceivirga thetidis]|uniref:Uncharacterized protein n=1 Tax=Croceivirga thetidis TaxID=2721623 RepID=A0ABX1GSS2_9FLAO|nr:hypothetical protein [Croceivirga thetidis]NKI32669.1 hypothetical protein [Croceivirga thetidis]